MTHSCHTSDDVVSGNGDFEKVHSHFRLVDCHLSLFFFFFQSFSSSSSYSPSFKGSIIGVAYEKQMRHAYLLTNELFLIGGVKEKEEVVGGQWHTVLEVVAKEEMYENIIIASTLICTVFSIFTRMYFSCFSLFLSHLSEHRQYWQCCFLCQLNPTWRRQYCKSTAESRLSLSLAKTGADSGYSCLCVCMSFRALSCQ